MSTGIKLKFDANHNVHIPTIVLAKRSGQKLGVMQCNNIVVEEGMNSASEMSFNINKAGCNVWNDIKDFRLSWVKDWDEWFEMSIELSDGVDTVKYATCKSLGESETSQITINSLEVNTEDDISRDDYEPTVIYSTDNKSASLLDILLEKAPHYSIGYVSPSIRNIQRTFSFDGKTIYDCFQEIAEEVDCIFVFDNGSDTQTGRPKRLINVYDLENYCIDCGKRGDIGSTCEHCGSSNIIKGYGEDTSIYVSSKNLSDNITLSSLGDEVKNCFLLKAGDDLMTSIVRQCNPNGSNYLWNISESTRDDMSDELHSAIDEYDKLYNLYQTNKPISLNESILERYNYIVEKYESSGCNKIISPIQNFPKLIEAYFETIDLYYYLSHNMMPSISTQSTTADAECNKINAFSNYTVAVKDLEKASSSTCTSAVISVIKLDVDKRYQIKVVDESESFNRATNIWSGRFKLTNYSDEEDTCTTNVVNITISDDIESFVNQKLMFSLDSNNNSSDDNPTDIQGIFKLSIEQSDGDESPFESELHKYSLSCLKNIQNACDSCISVMIQQGIADKDSNIEYIGGLYESFYEPYLTRMAMIDSEIQVRDGEISIVYGSYTEDGVIIEEGMQAELIKKRDEIQDILDFKAYLDSNGEGLWREFSMFRIEDTYSNDNFISDGLTTEQMFANAIEFIEYAKKEIYKASVLQHSIKSTLKNLLAMNEFSPIVDKFKIGNFIRLDTDGIVSKNRMIGYKINFDNFDDIEVEFSDTKIVRDDASSDIESILNKANSMSTSYPSVARQSKRGDSANSQLEFWAEKGLSLTNMKIIGNSDNQDIVFDEHGLIAREYDPFSDSYSDKQIKLVNTGVYFTTDGWKTAKSGIGDFIFWNPKTKQVEEGYGVIADTIVGNIILGEEVGIYNTGGGLSIDEDGVVITTYKSGEANANAFTIKREINGKEDKLMYVNSNGELVFNGSVIFKSSDGNYTADYVASGKKVLDQINPTLSDLQGYKYASSQWMAFDDTGLTIGKDGSQFKTIITNEDMSFLDGNSRVAWISNKELAINDATIYNSFTIGHFIFVPRDGGSISINWNE